MKKFLSGSLAVLGLAGVASAQTFTVPTGVDATTITGTLWTASGAWMIGFAGAAVVIGVVAAFISGFKGKSKRIAR